MTATVRIWSDIACPWALVATHRLRAAREADGIDVVFDQRAWPLELVNGRGAPRRLIRPEAAVLGNHEPDLFSYNPGEYWPSTVMPAFEAVAAARRVHGLRVAEDVDYHLRTAFFRYSLDISVRAGIERALVRAARDNGEIDVDQVMAVWETQPVRADVLGDYRRGQELPIQGSPQVFWPDGTTTHNPGMSDFQRVRGIPRLRSTDPQAPGRLLRERTAVPPGSGG